MPARTRRRCSRSRADSASRSRSITLPLADLGRQAWRIPFALGAFTIFLAPGDRPAADRDDALRGAAPRTDVDRGRVRDIRGQGYGRRFLLLAAVAFLLNVFSAPSSQLTNKYLTDVHHFSNSGIAAVPHGHDRHPRARRARARRPARRSARPAAGRGDRAGRRDRHRRWSSSSAAARCCGSCRRRRSSRRARAGSRSARWASSSSPPRPAARRTGCSA